MHHVAIDLDGTRIFGHDEAVAFTQHDIIVAARVGQGFIEFDTDIIDGVLAHLAGIETRAALHLRHLQQTLQTELLIFIEGALDTGATDIGLIGDTTCHLDGIGEAEVLPVEGIAAFEEHLALYEDVTLGHVARAAAHHHLIVRHEGEAAVAINQETILQREGEGFGYLLAIGRGLGVDDATRDIDTGGRSSIRETTSLDDQVLDGLVLGIIVGAWAQHLTQDDDVTLVGLILTHGDGEDILVLQRDIGSGAIEDAFEID